MFGRRNDIIVRLPSCIDINHLPNYNLNRKGQHARTRILSVFAYYHPDVSWAPLLAPITALFLHYMTEIDAYECLLIITSNNYKLITQTEIQYQSLILSFRSLLRRHCYSTYELILKSQQNIFDQWIWFIFKYLPFNYLIPIIDCLLIEDIKILIRFTMSLLHFFVKYPLNQPINLKRRNSIFHRKTISHFSLIKTDIINYIQQFDIPIEKLFKHAFSIHNLQRKEIFRIIQVDSFTSVRATSLRRSNSPSRGSNSPSRRSNSPFRRSDLSYRSVEYVSLD
jgi:hypothetical protein